MVLFEKCVDFIAQWIIYLGLPIVAIYHDLHESVFLNTAAKDASGLECFADHLLIPVHYLLEGNVAEPTKNGLYSYEIKKRFQYDDNLTANLAMSITLLPLSATLGTTCKILSFLSEDTRRRYQTLCDINASTKVISNNGYYKEIGIPIKKFEDMQWSDPPEFQKRLKINTELVADLQGLKEIAKILHDNEIPFWIDCGTCLGAYRYGGMIPWDTDLDIAVISMDFKNVKKALNALDPKKYIAQDWSSRKYPETYIRVYIKESHNHIDIYHFTINKEEMLLYSIVSNMESAYLPKSWKIRESRYTVATPISDVFPLKKMLFEGIEVCVPNNMKAYLQARFGEDLRPAKIYNPSTDTYEKDLSHPYWQRAYVH